MRAIRRPIGERWTAECSALLERLNAQGLTDGEIARAIEARTGLRFSRRWIAVQREAHQIGSCWNKWGKR
jgi:glutamate synthase domain-containing protein 1